MDAQKNVRKLMFVFCLAVVLGLLMGSAPAEATVKKMKVYKEAFPGTKPKCLFCHTNKIPKKKDGLHDLNAYGLKAKAIEEDPMKETFQQVGTVEDFEAQSKEVAGEEAVEEEVAVKDGDEEDKINQ